MAAQVPVVPEREQVLEPARVLVAALAVQVVAAKRDSITIRRASAQGRRPTGLAVT